VTGAERENELMKFISLKLADLGCNLVIMGDNIKDEKEMNFINDLKNKEVDVKYFSVSGGNLQEINRTYQSVVTEYGNIDLLVSIFSVFFHLESN
jgi:NAD(P)-dependent dehydrogenase (short-subunit alcohol dehydrogenase family)